MNPRITIVSATSREIEPLIHFLEKNATRHSFQTFQYHQLLIDVLYTGIGIMQTTYALMEYVGHRHPDGWIQAGIGGAFDHHLAIGEVYWIESEMLAGFGAQYADGHVADPFELGWADPDAFPYSQGRLRCPYRPESKLAMASGMTTFTSHGHELQIEWLSKGKTGQVENMEGAPFFYISLLRKIPFLSLRSISNRVEVRDTAKWQIDLAIKQLNQALLEWLHQHHFNVDRLFDLGHPG